MQRRNQNLQAVVSTSTQTPVAADLLFEATEALIKALWMEDPKAGVDAALTNAIRSPWMAVFDAPETYQAIAFLRRLGYLSPDAMRES